MGIHRLDDDRPMETKYLKGLVKHKANELHRILSVRRDHLSGTIPCTVGFGGYKVSTSLSRNGIRQLKQLSYKVTPKQGMGLATLGKFKETTDEVFQPKARVNI